MSSEKLERIGYVNFACSRILFLVDSGLIIQKLCKFVVIGMRITHAGDLVLRYESPGQHMSKNTLDGRLFSLSGKVICKIIKFSFRAA